MSILKIARMGHPVLRQVAKPIDPEKITNPVVQGLIRDLLETLVEYNGIGLAAPQVHHPVRMVICGGEEDEEGRTVLRVFINPEVTPTTDEVFGMYEGCLSLPGLRGYVERPAAVTVKAFNEKGEPVSVDLEGFPAVVAQHEIDHLDGILYVDCLQDTKLLAFEEEAQRYLPMESTETEDAREGEG